MATFRRALLVVVLDVLDTPHHLDPAIAAATNATSDALVVILLSDAFAPTAPASWAQVQTLLAHVYVQASKAAHQQNNLLLDVSVLLNSVLSPDALPPAIDVCFRVDDSTSPPPSLPTSPTHPLLDISLPDPLSSVPHAFLPSHPRPAPSPTFAQIRPSPLSPRYPVVALGGTFDHLHAGHKILLSMAAWIASRKVVVGITGTPPPSPPSSRAQFSSVDALLKKKSNPHLLEPFHTRADRTRSFLMLFRPDLEYELFDLQDVYGPTGSDPDIQALVVSKETLSGAVASTSLPHSLCHNSSLHPPVDRERARKGLPTLQTFIIDVISSDSSKLDHEDAEILKQTKMSSTFIREWIASNHPHSAR
ncbi:hypothetical protein J3R82DRAFT_5724 [Butyriboletus roseoflavus]|nr:hypothetical protein J3R82DRAFT_5724 [Butyriboletus roseoflavus]